MPLLTFGQKIDRQVIAAAGDHLEAASTSITWTLGELVTESFTSGNLFLSQGFQQGNMEVTSIRGIQADFELKAYPNPVMDILIVETEKLDLKYRLIDMDGKVLKIGTINSSSYELDFTGFPSGMYFLWVEENQTHKIIKN